jgi:hypothetical protein
LKPLESDSKVYNINPYENLRQKVGIGYFCEHKNLKLVIVINGLVCEFDHGHVINNFNLLAENRIKDCWQSILNIKHQHRHTIFY